VVGLLGNLLNLSNGRNASHLDAVAGQVAMSQLVTPAARPQPRRFHTCPERVSTLQPPDSQLSGALLNSPTTG
jgi:hypothetical protein